MSKNNGDLCSVTEFDLAMLVIERNVCQYQKEQYDELINRIGQAKGFSDITNGQTTKPETKSQPTALQEFYFTTLKFGTQQSEKMGEYEVAHKNSNMSDNWQSAINILRSSNVTIKTRYYGESYEYTYWLYGEDKIYRQKLKPKA